MDKFTLKAILSAVDNLSPVLKSVQGVAKTTRKYLGDVGTSINGLTSKFGLPLGIASTIAAGFGIGAIKHAVVSFAELGEEIQKGAFKTGMSTDEFQRMKYVVEQAGLDVNALGLSMGKLNKNLGAAAMGKNASLVELMKTLKIPMKDANGQMRSAAEMLPQLADAFSKNQDPIKQAAIGTALFGKSYQDMLPFLNEGSEGIAQSLERFKRLKGIIPAEDVKGAKEFGDKLADVAFVTKGFQMTIARELLPVLSPMVEGFIQWAAAGKKVVGVKVKEAVQELVAQFKAIDWRGFLAGLESSFTALKRGVEAVGGLKNALVILAVIMNAQTLAAMFGMVGALGRLAIAFGVASIAAWQASAAFLASAAASGSVVTVMTTSLALAAKSAGLVGAAALVGYAVGSAIYKAIEDWDFTKALGEGIARVLAFFGNESAKRSLEVTDQYAKSLTGPVAQTAPAFRAMAPQLKAMGPIARDAPMAAAAPVLKAMGPIARDAPMAAAAPVLKAMEPVARGAAMVAAVPALKTMGPQLKAMEPVARDAAAVAAMPALKAIAPQVATLAPVARSAASAAAPLMDSVSPQSFDGSRRAPAPGQIGSGSFNLVQPSNPTATLTGKVDINFANAPPGMRVEQAQTTAPRVAVNTNVGYRSLATEAGF